MVEHFPQILASEEKATTTTTTTTGRSRGGGAKKMAQNSVQWRNVARTLWKRPRKG